MTTMAANDATFVALVTPSHFTKSLSCGYYQVMPLEADDEAFTALLAPWWDVFSTCRITLRHDGEHSTDHVKTASLIVQLCDAGDNAVATWRHQCEAISILLLAAVIKPRAFFRAAIEHCNLNSPIFIGAESVEYEFSVLLTRSYMRSMHPTWSFEALTRLFFPEECESVACKATRAELLCLVWCPEKRRGCESKMFPVAIVMDIESDKRIASVLRHFIRLHSAQQSGTQGVKHSVGRFFAKSVDLRVVSSSYSTELLDAIELLASKPNLRLRFTTFGHTEAERTRSACQRWIRAVTGTSLEDSAVQSKGARKITVSELADDEEFGQLMISLASSRGVHSVTLFSTLHRDQGYRNMIR